MFESRYDQRHPGPMQAKRVQERSDAENSFSRSPGFALYGDRDNEDDDQLGDEEYNETSNTYDGAQSNSMTKADSSRQHDPLSPMDAKIDKRKMKRFRLTHNQTRYLMSEFARQAHPDAAHRERLSREIPGLSPRQVQVWFQNRRAKLKRMSSDDRDRMMRSRALPEEFPLLQTLHSYGASKMSDTHTSPVEQLQNKHSEMKPLSYHSLPRHMSSDSLSMAHNSGQSYGALPFSSPRLIGGLPSPISTTSGHRPSLPYLSTPVGTNPLRGNPFSSPTSREGFRPNQHSLSQQPTVPRTFSDMSNLPSVHSQQYASSGLNTEGFTNDVKNFYLPNHTMGLPRTMPGNELGASYISSTSPSMSQPYPSPHKPAFTTPLNLMTYKYQMPMTPHTAGTTSFPENSLQASPELVNSMPQQLSAPPDATTFSTSYLTSTHNNTSYSHDGFMSPKTAITSASKDSSFGRWYGHRSRRSCSHPPDFLHASTAPTVS